MSGHTQRRLAAILAADVVGYSRLMGGDEAGTLAALRALREELIKPKVDQHGGRIVKLIGDGLLAEFPSAVAAVTCAVEVQVLNAERNAAIPEERQIVFRIGINIGDVIVEDDDIYGDGVNVAARLEGLADPGGICIARSVRDQVRDKLSLGWADRGDIQVKNIARPVRVFSILLDEQAAALATAVVLVPAKSAQSPRLVLAAGLAVAIILAAGLIWWHSLERAPGIAAMNPKALPPADKPSIAVLPFDNLSNEEEQEYFADGLTDDLITDLSKVSGLFVIARNSVFTYKGRAADVREVARDLGVRYILEGSVRRAGDAVRINAKLLDGATGDHIWAERYDRRYTDIFSIQDQVIESIVQALSVELTDIERIEVAYLPTDNLEAYDYYLQGEKLAYHAEASSVSEALQFYQRAFALDPDFAEAYAGYARVAVDVLSFNFANSLPSAVARKRAFEAASRAVSLNPRLPRSYSVLALLQMLESEHDNALMSARRAVALSPNNADAHLNLAVVQVYAGQQEEALEAMETVLRLNPKPPGYVHDYHALALFMNQRHAEALTVLEANNTSERSALGLELLAEVNAVLGRMDAAKAVVAQMLTRWPDENLAFYRVVLAHHARDEDLAARLEALRLAGLPEWPHGFEGKPELRLLGAAIDVLTENKTWAGERVGIGPFTQYMQANGGFVERGPDYQLAGSFFRREDQLCLQSPAVLMGRPDCGPIYRSATAGGRDEYVYPNAHRLKRFSVNP